MQISKLTPAQHYPPALAPNKPPRLSEVELTGALEWTVACMGKTARSWSQLLGAASALAVVPEPVWFRLLKLSGGDRQQAPAGRKASMKAGSRHLTGTKCRIYADDTR